MFQLPSGQGVPDPGYRVFGNVCDKLTERIQLSAGDQIDHSLPQCVQAFRVTFDRADLMRNVESRRSAQCVRELLEARLRHGDGVSSGQTRNNRVRLRSPGQDEQLFVAPENGNFYPAAGSRIIDSSVDSLEDRTTLKEVRDPLGITESPILAPDTDIYGQVRSDDPDAQPPSGVGDNVFKDRGAIDRVDFSAPMAEIIDPMDNDPGGIDRDGRSVDRLGKRLDVAPSLVPGVPSLAVNAVELDERVGGGVGRPDPGDQQNQKDRSRGKQRESSHDNLLSSNLHFSPFYAQTPP